MQQHEHQQKGINLRDDDLSSPPVTPTASTNATVSSDPSSTPFQQERAQKRKAKRQKWSQRRDKQQHIEEAPKHSIGPKKGKLVQVSSDPLIFTIDEFIDPELCRRVQNDATGCFALDFPEQVAQQLFQHQASEMDGLLFNVATSAEHEDSKQAFSTRRLPDGLHMDTNNQCLFRHVTCILYLNDVPVECGGATCFPLAHRQRIPASSFMVENDNSKDDDDDANDDSNNVTLAASRRLLDQHLSHTRSRSCDTLGLAADAQSLETASAVDTDIIRIQPAAGRLCVFFSRRDDGTQDARAWHAGERLLANTTTGTAKGQVTEKRILTLFKEVHYDESFVGGGGSSDDDDDDDDTVDTTAQHQRRRRRQLGQQTTLEDFLAPMVSHQRRWLQAQALLQKTVLEFSQ
eukprot:scaffold34929_cov160-Amphora_coffeaeformis.AAC.4